MSSTSFDPSDLIIPAFDANAKTVEITVDIHPGQARQLDYLASAERLSFRDRENVVRWCIAWGTHTLDGPLPSSFSLVEAKMNVLHDERFQRQKDCLADSVQKYLAAGEKENARRALALTSEEYNRITSKYWRDLWLSTLEPGLEMLRQHEVRDLPHLKR
jgi:hypothetical protein